MKKETMSNGKHKQILRGIQGTIKAGEMLAILGPSGAGKTTLLNMLTLEATTGTGYGTIALNGTELGRNNFVRNCYYGNTHNTTTSNIRCPCPYRGPLHGAAWCFCVVCADVVCACFCRVACVVCVCACLCVVPQEGSHHAFLTPRETLTYAASLFSKDSSEQVTCTRKHKHTRTEPKAQSTSTRAGTQAATDTACNTTEHAALHPTSMRGRAC